MATFNVLVSTPAEWVPPRTLGILAAPQAGATATTAVFSIPGPPPRVLTLDGTGFTYNPDGFLTDGTVTGMRLSDGAALPGVTLWTASGLSIGATAFLGAVNVDLWPLLLAGHDVMTGSAGGDRLFGGTGNDSISGGDGNDRLDGGLGNDTLRGGNGNDALFGGAGNDLLDPGAGRDIIRAGAGDDVVRATEVEAMAGLGEIWDGGAGEDVLSLALGAGLTLDLGQATVVGFEALRFETASRLALTAGALLPIERIELTYNGRVAGGETAGLVLRGEGVFDMSGFTVSGLAGRGLRVFIDDGNGAVVFGGEDTADLANDVILGGAGDSSIFGGGGRDNVQAGGGQDLVDGGDDNDTLGGGDGNDTVLGGAGADFLDGGLGDDSMDGGAGNDLMAGADGDDVLRGGAGFDSLAGGNGDDSMEGGTENDTLRGEDGLDTLKGDAGNDRLYGGLRADSLEGGIGDDQLWGDEDNDRLFGGDGNDRLDGGAEHDLLEGGSGNDTLIGGDGSDTLIGGSGADVMSGGAGDDTYFWSMGEGDTIVDASGYDRVQVFGVLFSLPNGIEEARLNNPGSLAGNTLNNLLVGSSGNDFLLGGGGNDTLVGTTGADTLSGGAGNDRYVLGVGQGGNWGLVSTDIEWPAPGTRINDFSRSAGNRDVIDVSEPFFLIEGVQAHGAPVPDAGWITYETVGANSLLRFYYYDPVTDALGFHSVEVMGVTGAWTTADFIGW